MRLAGVMMAVLSISGCSSAERTNSLEAVRHCDARSGICYEGTLSLIIRPRSRFRAGHSSEDLLGAFYDFRSGEVGFPRVTCLDADACTSQRMAFMRCGLFVVPASAQDRLAVRIDGLDADGMRRVCRKGTVIGEF